MVEAHGGRILTKRGSNLYQSPILMTLSKRGFKIQREGSKFVQFPQPLSRLLSQLQHPHLPLPPSPRQPLHMPPPQLPLLPQLSIHATTVRMAAMSALEVSATHHKTVATNGPAVANLATGALLAVLIPRPTTRAR